MQYTKGKDIIIRDETIRVFGKNIHCLRFIDCDSVRLERVTFICEGLPHGALNIQNTKEVLIREVKVVGAAQWSALDIRNCHTVTAENLTLEADKQGYSGGLILIEADQGTELGHWRMQGITAENLKLHPTLTTQNFDIILIHNALSLAIVESTFKNITNGFDSALDIGWKRDDAILPPGYVSVRDCIFDNVRRIKVTGYAKTNSYDTNHNVEFNKIKLSGTRFEPYYGEYIKVELQDVDFSNLSYSPIKLGSSSRQNKGDIVLRRVTNNTKYPMIDEKYNIGNVEIFE